MPRARFYGASLIALASAPAWAQTETTPPPVDEIIVTAQRTRETLQSVPIAVSAFNAENLKQQQINTSSDLQLTLPNITFTKTNFTSSSFTIRGIGDLCTGATCDSATGIHLNETPLLGSRIFENEYLDLERVEVLRGPQGTLYGRNATSGVVNFITAKPDLSGMGGSGEVEYGNFNSLRVKGMLNMPVGETFGVRLAGYYLKRDGFTDNLYTGGRIDGRDMYGLRGSLRWQPTPDTTVDFMASYFREKDNRSRIQKQLCHRDPTGVLGCLPDRLGFETLNGDATLASILTSREFLAIRGAPTIPTPGGPLNLANLGLGSVYGNDGDVFSGAVNPTDLRTVRVDYDPTYYAREENYLGSLRHNFGNVGLSISGGYSTGVVDSRTDYNLAVENSYANNPGLLTLAAVAQSPLLPFRQVAAALIPNGPAGNICQSDATSNDGGVYSGARICSPQSLDFDRSVARTKQWTVEGHIDTKFDGMFNFLAGAMYLDNKVYDNDYYVNSFGLDYASGILGALTTLGQRFGGNTAFPQVFLGTPFYRNASNYFHLKSWGLFGEAYLQMSDRLKLTLGARYNNDDKFYRARTTLLQDSAGGAPLMLYGSTNLSQALNAGALDYNAQVPGPQAFAESSVSFKRLTGRAVIDFQITPRNLLYASYSRGYKSGGINPPLSLNFQVPTTFDPEQVDAFEIGSKNTIGGGALRLNLTAFYYKYKKLQLSRIVARTSVNDNVDADIWGVEAEAIFRPVRDLLVNLNASYLNTKVTSDKFLANPRDPSGGRADAVIIKDITNTSNCAVTSNAGSAAAVNAFVGGVNQAINAGLIPGVGAGAGLRAPVPVPGTRATGAFSICQALQGAAATAPAALGGITYHANGVETNIRGAQLPQAPSVKFSAGVQYTFRANDWSIVPRFDVAFTGGYYGSIFNTEINRVKSFEVLNAQVQVNAPDNRFFVRGFIQNITDNNAITGLYATDQSSGLFTNAFTLEPRRYGIAAGFSF